MGECVVIKCWMVLETVVLHDGWIRFGYWFVIVSVSLLVFFCWWCHCLLLSCLNLD